MPLNHLLVLLELTQEKKNIFRNKPVWNLLELSYNPNITLDFILKYLNGAFNKVDFRSELSWFGISQNSCITVKNILDHMDQPESPDRKVEIPLPWDWGGISHNPNITIDFIIDHPDKPWVWWAISDNPAITTMNNILKYPDFPWNWGRISHHSNITVKDILNHPALPWKWKNFSWNKNITIDFMMNHRKLPSNKRKGFTDWNWDGVSRNPNITIDFIIEHLVLNKGWTAAKQKI